MALNVGTLFASLKLQDDGFNKQVGEKGNAMKSIIGGATKAVAIAGAAAFTAFTAGAGMAIKTGVSYNAELEMMNTAWKTLTGSAEGANKMVTDLGKFAAKTPFSQMGLDSMAKYLYNADFTGQDLFTTLTKFGDIGGAFGLAEDSITELVRQFGQMKNAGVAYTEDLNVFEQRGIPIMKELAKIHGVTTADIKKMASEGKISYEMMQEGVDSLAKNTEGAMEAQSQTFKGLTSTLKDNVQMLAAELSKPIFETMKSGLEFILANLDKVQPVIAAVQAAFESFRAAAMNFLEPIATQVKTFLQSFSGTSSATGALDKLKAVVSTLQPIFNMVFPFVKSIVQDAVSFIASLLGQLTAFWQSNGQQIMAATKIVWGLITTIIKAALTVLLPLVQSIWGNIKGVIQGAMNIILGIIKTVSALITGDWRGAWEGVKQIIMGAVQFIWNAVQLWFVGRMVMGIKGAVMGIRAAISTGFTAARTAAVNAVNAMRAGVTNTFSAIGSTIGNVVSGIRTMVAYGFNSVRMSATSAVNGLRSAVVAGFNAVRSVISGVMSNIRNVVMQGFNAVRSAATVSISGVRNVVTAGFNAVRSTITAVMTAVRSVVSTAFNAIRSIAASAVSGVRSVVATGFNAVRNVVNVAMNGVRSAVMQGFNAARSAAASGVNAIRSVVSSVFGALRGIVSGNMNGVTSAIKTGWGAAQRFLGSINLTNIGKSIIQGLIGGINAMMGKVAESIANVGKTITGGIKKVMGVNSPSRVMRDEVGKWIPAGLAVGIDRNAKSAVKSAAALAKSVTDEAGKYDISGAAYNANGKYSTIDSNGRNGGGSTTYNHTTVINSPRELNAREVAKQDRRASRNMALEVGLI